jgi:hypothetical protein
MAPEPPGAVARSGAPVVAAHGRRVVAVERVEDADRVGFVGQIGDLGAGCPAEGGYLIGGGQVSPGDLAEDRGYDSPARALVDTGEGGGLDVEAGSHADFAAQAVIDGLAEFQDAAGRVGVGLMKLDTWWNAGIAQVSRPQRNPGSKL